MDFMLQHVPSDRPDRTPDTPQGGGASAPATLQRARGEGRVSFKLRDDGRTALDRLHQSGAAKIRLPRLPERCADPVAVLLNTSGGITGGDRLRYEARWAAGTSATLTSQTAERIYRRAAGAGEVHNCLTVGEGARAEWLPQETIVFDKAALRRRFEARLSATARLLAVETVFLGRAAMGESVRQTFFRDSWRVWRDGRLAFADETRLEGDARLVLSGPATGLGARCFSTVLDIGPGAEEGIDRARAALAAALSSVAHSGGERRCEAGASAWDGKLVVRLAGADGQALRRVLVHFLEAYRGTVLPRVWHC